MTFLGIPTSRHAERSENPIACHAEGAKRLKHLGWNCMCHPGPDPSVELGAPHRGAPSLRMIRGALSAVHAAVNIDGGAGDKLRFIGSQKQRRIGDILRPCESPEGYL